MTNVRAAFPDGRFVAILTSAGGQFPAKQSGDSVPGGNERNEQNPEGGLFKHLSIIPGVA